MPFTWNDAEADVYRADDAEVHLWRPARGLLVTRLKGQAKAGCLAFYTGRAEREMALGRLTVFHDWTQMTGYEPAARDELKRWGRAHNDDFDHVEYLVRSKVVAMLISVAALTIGRDLHATTDRAAFAADLSRALAERGV